MEVEVKSGVVKLSGLLAEQKNIDRAENIANRVSGVVTVQSSIKRDFSVEENVSPMVEKIDDQVGSFVKSIPLFAIALLVCGLIILVGFLISNFKYLWQKILPNNFLVELFSMALKVFSVIVGIAVSLNLLGATALFAGMLGTISIIGLGISFAIRETLENYISSIMLSIRQPFRAGDHIVVNNHEGRVVRLTPRATILMTLEGNHLRIPNSDIYKATILNYSTNPERQFNFEVGVDAEDDPVAAIKTALEEVNKLDFVLKEPEANGYIKQIGDSSIIIVFKVWINQLDTDYFKAQTITIRTVMKVLESGGFTMPEPIYRLRFDTNNANQVLEDVIGGKAEEKIPKAKKASKKKAEKPSSANEVKLTKQDLDVKPNAEFEQKVKKEIENSDNKDDLLNDKTQTE